MDDVMLPEVVEGVAQGVKGVLDNLGSKGSMKVERRASVRVTAVPSIRVHAVPHSSQNIDCKPPATTRLN